MQERRKGKGKQPLDQDLVQHWRKVDLLGISASDLLKQFEAAQPIHDKILKQHEKLTNETRIQESPAQELVDFYSTETLEVSKAQETPVEVNIDKKPGTAKSESPAAKEKIKSRGFNKKPRRTKLSPREYLTRDAKRACSLTARELLTGYPRLHRKLYSTSRLRALIALLGLVWGIFDDFVNMWSNGAVWEEFIVSNPLADSLVETNRRLCTIFLMTLCILGDLPHLLVDSAACGWILVMLRQNLKLLTSCTGKGLFQLGILALLLLQGKHNNSNPTNLYVVVPIALSCFYNLANSIFWNCKLMRHRYELRRVEQFHNLPERLRMEYEKLEKFKSEVLYAGFRKLSSYDAARIMLEVGLPIPDDALDVLQYLLPHGRHMTPDHYMEWYFHCYSVKKILRVCARNEKCRRILDTLTDEWQWLRHNV